MVPTTPDEVPRVTGTIRESKVRKELVGFGTLDIVPVQVPETEKDQIFSLVKKSSSAAHLARSPLRACLAVLKVTQFGKLPSGLRQQVYLE